MKAASEVLTKLRHSVEVALTPRLPQDSRFLQVGEDGDLSLFRKSSDNILGIVQPWAPLTDAQDKELMDFVHNVAAPHGLYMKDDLHNWRLSGGNARLEGNRAEIQRRLFERGAPESVTILKEGLIKKFVEATGMTPDLIYMDINRTDETVPHRHEGENFLLYTHKGAATTGYKGDLAYQFPAKSVAVCKGPFMHNSPSKEIAQCSLQDPRISFAFFRRNP